MSTVKRKLVTADLKGVLILLRPLKDLTAKQLVTGRVQRILTRAAVMLGVHGTNMPQGECEACRQAAFSMISLICCCHFISLSKDSGDGKSILYRSASSLTLETQSPDSRETKREGTTERPSIAILW